MGANVLKNQQSQQILEQIFEMVGVDVFRDGLLDL